MVPTGGPGSGKGKIVSELLKEQITETVAATELISTELLIFDQLPHKVSNAIKLHSTKDITGELCKISYHDNICNVLCEGSKVLIVLCIHV